MTEPQITAALSSRPELPSVYSVISEFRISYQKALRCWIAAGGQPGAVQAPAKKVYSMEDF